MEYRPIEVKLICGKDLKDVNVFSTMDVYVVGSVSGDPRSMQQTAVHKDGGINPTWNHVMRFNVDESAARLNRLGLVFQIMSNRTLGDKEIGRVYVPLKELFDVIEVIDENSDEEKNVIYQVQTSTGRFKGYLEFSYKFGKKFTHTFEQTLDPISLQLDINVNEANKKIEDEPVIAYPPGSPVPELSHSTMAYPQGSPVPEPSHSGPGFPGGPAPGSNILYPGVRGGSPYIYGGPPPGYPQQGYGYGYQAHQSPPPAPPQPNGYMGYGYGYPAGYSGYPYPGQPSTAIVQQQVKPPKKKGGRFSLGAAAGLGAGLLGGLLVGEMVEHVADPYDDMCDF